jgi:superfamily II DNA or RNA helicase
MVKFDYDKTYRKGRLICDESTLKFVRNHFSIKDKNAAFVNRKSFGRKIPDRKYAVQATGLFDFGLHQEIRKFLIDKQINDIQFTDSFNNHLKVGYDVQDLFDGLKYELRDYQKESVEESLRIGSGTNVLATSSGKSLIQAALIENISRIHPKFKCILIVPGLSLVNQLVQDFKDYNVTFTYSGWTGDLSLQDTSVVITNSENLNAKFGTNKWITEVDVVVVDECHRANCSSTLSKVVSKIKTPNKFGFTGTLPPDDLDRWKVIGTFGPVIYEKKSKELRDEGYISNVMIRILKLIHPKSKKKTYQDEITYLVEHEGRNKIIRNLVKKFEKNCLILVNTLDHGHILNDILQLEGKETVFIHGGIPVDERDIIKSRMELNDNIICIAMSSIFSTGINIKNIHYIIFVSGGKSFIRIVQSIGRGLRLHSDKSRLVLFDICDNLKYSENHLEERKQFYQDEEIPFKETEINL